MELCFTRRADRVPWDIQGWRLSGKLEELSNDLDWNFAVWRSVMGSHRAGSAALSCHLYGKGHKSSIKSRECSQLDDRLHIWVWTREWISGLGAFRC
jgi:hypothetical protein